MVYVSDLRRAVATAEIAFGDSGVRIVQDPRLRECNYGELNGMPVEKLTAIRGQHVDVPFPGGQSYRDVVRETQSFLADLARERDGSNVVIISHSANRWALQCLLEGKRLEDLVDAPFDWQEGWPFTLPSGWSSPARQTVA